MQERLKRKLLRLSDIVRGNDRHERTVRRREIVLGLGGMLAVGLLLAASAIVYLLPIGKSSYAADLTEAGSVQVGDEIRIAGIAVGAVRSLELRDDSVRMMFTVDREIFLGDRSTLDIRMLTAIGGHYVALYPTGKNALGDGVIPADHVTLPYSLAEALQDSVRPVETVDAATLRGNLDKLTAAMDTSPDAIHQMTDAMAAFTGLVNKQNDRVNRALEVADEYVGLLGEYRAVIGTMLTKIGVMETMVLNRRAEVLDALRVVTELLSRIAAIEPTWRSQLEPLADKFFEAVPKMQELGQRLGAVADSIRDVGTRLQGLSAPQGGIVIDQSVQTIPMATVCIPVPGKEC